jgi:hypothetical protein
MKFCQENFVDYPITGGLMRIKIGEKSWDGSEKADCSLGTIGLFEPKNS